MIIIIKIILNFLLKKERFLDSKKQVGAKPFRVTYN